MTMAVSALCKGGCARQQGLGKTCQGVLLVPKEVKPAASSWCQTKPSSQGSHGAYLALANGSSEQQVRQQRVKSLRWNLVSCFLPANNNPARGKRDSWGSAGSDSDGATLAPQLRRCWRKPQHIICWPHLASLAALGLWGPGPASS